MSRIESGVETMFEQGRRGLFSVLALAITLAGCTRNSTDSAASANDSGTSRPRVVNLAIWANYLTPEMMEKFTRETGIQIKVSNFSSNEELLAKVQAGASGIDVAVPSDYMVEVLAKEGHLQPLDPNQIPNRSGLDPAFLKQEYDPENKFSLPYAWTTAGIAVNRDLYKGPIRGWKDLFANKELAGKISLLDDVREVTGIALKMNGASVNSNSPEELNKAKETLKKAKPLIKMFASDVIDPLVNKEVAVAHAYSSDALQAAARTGGKVEFILPEEGATRAIDNVVIMKGAANQAEAHALINFLLSKEANVSFVKSIFGGPVVLASRNSLPDELKANGALFPSPTLVSKLERIHDVGSATRLYDRLWTEIK